MPAKKISGNHKRVRVGRCPVCHHSGSDCTGRLHGSSCCICPSYNPVLQTPAIAWTKPLTPCGPEDDPLVKLLGRVSILGASFHAEAYAVKYKNDEQVGQQDESETWLGEVLHIVQGAANTIRIGRREYVLAITPCQR